MRGSPVNIFTSSLPSTRNRCRVKSLVSYPRTQHIGPYRETARCGLLCPSHIRPPYFPSSIQTTSMKMENVTDIMTWAVTSRHALFSQCTMDKHGRSTLSRWLCNVAVIKCIFGKMRVYSTLNDCTKRELRESNNWLSNFWIYCRKNKQDKNKLTFRRVPDVFRQLMNCKSWNEQLGCHRAIIQPTSSTHSGYGCL